MIRLRINSTDSSLVQLCSDILGQIGVKSLKILTEPGQQAELGCDICIWDYSNDLTLPELAEGASYGNQLFLVERHQIPAILSKLPLAPIGLLIKPVTRTTLTTFLEQCVARLASHETNGDSMGIPGTESDRDELLQFLLQANLRLQEFDHDRTNFLARAMHDFRAPLTALNGYCGLLLEGMLGPLGDDQKEIIQRMAQSGRRLARMSSSLYSLTMGREGRRPLRLEQALIEQCVQQAIHELARVCHEKHLAVSTDLKPAPCPLYFEPTQIEQLLINLLENASKFTPRYGRIEIAGYPYFWERRTVAAASPAGERRSASSAEPNMYRIDVKDSGPGIPEQFMPLIFEDYTSYSNPHDRSGGGLGLAICNTIAQAHRGRIWAKSEDGGVTFSFMFPLRPFDYAEERSALQLGGPSSYVSWAQ